MKLFSGFSFQIYAIDNGRVSPHLKDPNVNQYLPTIPSEVSYVNFTWASGPKKYNYHFDRLQSMDESILKSPTISIDTIGVVPKSPQGERWNSFRCPAKRTIPSPAEFSVWLPCSEENSGIAIFSIGLLIQARRTGKPLPGTPLRLTLKKECAHRGMNSDRTSLMASQGSVFIAFSGRIFVEILCICLPHLLTSYFGLPLTIIRTLIHHPIP